MQTLRGKSTLPPNHPSLHHNHPPLPLSELGYHPSAAQRPLPCRAVPLGLHHRDVPLRPVPLFGQARRSPTDWDAIRGNRLSLLHRFAGVLPLVYSHRAQALRREVVKEGPVFVCLAAYCAAAPRATVGITRTARPTPLTTHKHAAFFGFVSSTLGGKSWEICEILATPCRS